MTKPKVLTDPRNPEIEAFISAQDEGTEFCLRLALNGLSSHVRGDRRYQARFRELQDKLVKTTDDLVRYLRRSDSMRDSVVQALSAQPAVEC
jgi:hypothetical protein